MFASKELSDESKKTACPRMMEIDRRLENIKNLILERKATGYGRVNIYFAESEVISLVAEGVKKFKILRGLHKAIIKRLTGMVYRIGLNNQNY